VAGCAAERSHTAVASENQVDRAMAVPLYLRGCAP
jgi:hypothetical protein